MNPNDFQFCVEQMQLQHLIGTVIASLRSGDLLMTHLDESSNACMHVHSNGVIMLEVFIIHCAYIKTAKTVC